MRGLESVSLIYCSEAAFFNTDSETLRETTDVLERYAGKSSSKIILESTVNRVGDLLWNIFNNQPFEKSFYKLLRLSYEWGVGKIYSQQDIEIAKASSSFNREYNLSWSSPSGTTFLQSSIDRAVELGKKYPDMINKDADHTLGIDPGFGGSSFMAFVVLEYSDDKIKVVLADQYNGLSFSEGVQKYWDIKNLVGNLSATYVDASSTEYVGALKDEIGENSNWQYIREKIAYCKKNRLRLENGYMKIIPISFGQMGPAMISHCQALLDNDEGLVVINPKFQDLIIGLRGAVSMDGRLIKEESPNHDLIDGFRLAANYFTLGK